MSNVRIFKEIQKKKMGDVSTLLCLRSAELSKAFGLRNLCFMYSKISAVMLLCTGLPGSRENTFPSYTQLMCINAVFLFFLYKY